MLDEKSNNYIGNVLDLKYAYVVCYSDITTGEFNAFVIEHDDESLELPDETLNKIRNLRVLSNTLTSKKKP